MPCLPDHHDHLVSWLNFYNYVAILVWSPFLSWSSSGVTWYPTVVAMVRMITTNVIAAWLAIVELLKIVMYWVIVMIMKLLNKNPKHIGFGDYCDICNAVYYAFSICQCIALIINLMGHNWLAMLRALTMLKTFVDNYHRSLVAIVNNSNEYDNNT